jgi:3-deoxy-D-manno-octulosonate 8-phosphate phosphatase KdsC-like HAD superfamily phosphatase
MEQTYVQKTGAVPLMDEIQVVFSDLDHTLNEGDEFIEAHLVRRYSELTGDQTPLKKMEKMMGELYNTEDYKSCPEKCKEIRKRIRREMDTIMDMIPAEYLEKEELYSKIIIRDGVDEFIQKCASEGKEFVGISMAHPYVCQHFSQKYKVQFIACRNDNDKKTVRNEISQSLGVEPEGTLDIGDGSQDWLGYPSSHFIQVGDMHERIRGSYAKVKDFREIIGIVSKERIC